MTNITLKKKSKLIPTFNYYCLYLYFFKFVYPSSLLITLRLLCLITYRIYKNKKQMIINSTLFNYSFTFCVVLD